MQQRRGLELYAMWIPSNSPIPMRQNTRVRWVWDPDHDTRANYAQDRIEAGGPIFPLPSKAEADEIDKLERGELVALGCIMETRCGDCGQWRELNSLWGVVILAENWALEDFFTENKLGACFEGEHWNKGKDDA